MIGKKDLEILREIATNKSEIANLPQQKQNIKMWEHTNDLIPEKPPFLIYQIPWGEMDINRELECVIEDPFLQSIENKLRQEIYIWKYLRANSVVTSQIENPIVVKDSRFGIEEKFDFLQDNENSKIQSKHFHIQIKEPEDIKKIKDPIIEVDINKTNQNYEIMSEVFEGILDVKNVGKRGLWFTPWDYLIRLTGVQEVLYDLIERPEYVEKLVERFVEASLVRLSEYDKFNIWSTNNTNTPVGSGGYGYTGQLSRDGCNETGIFKSKDIWGCGNAQIFSCVSPEMHWDFSLKYENLWLEKFGLNYYGCCEPLHHKIEILEKVPNLRKISMSPWANLEIAKQKTRGKYVLSCKPDPSILLKDNYSPKAVERQITKILEETKGCSIEIILKDISTVENQPERLWEYSQIAMETIDNWYYKNADLSKI